MFYVSSSSSLFTFVSFYLFAEAETEEEALRPWHLVWYGHDDWPSYSEWMVPR